jgi:hypothetical protein
MAEAVTIAAIFVIVAIVLRLGLRLSGDNERFRRAIPLLALPVFAVVALLVLALEGRL